MREVLSNHFCERDTKIDMLVLHCFALSVEDALKEWDKLKVSTHYILDEFGEIIKVVDESKKAYHVGIGYWRKFEGGLNSRSIGIEVYNKTLGQAAYNEVQIENLILLIKGLVKKYDIRPVNVVGHSDVAVLRKADPGICFPGNNFFKMESGFGMMLEMLLK